jgi:two-component system OmpR family sensor kinase
MCSRGEARSAVRRLHTRIYLHFLAVLLVVGLAAAFVLGFGARGAFLRDTSARVATHVAALAGESLGDPAALARRLEQVRADLGVDAAVRGLDGRLLAAAGRPLPGPSAAELAEARAGRTVVHVHSRRGWHEVVAPVRDPRGDEVAAVLVTSLRHRFPGRALVTPVAMVAVVLAVAAVATRPLARRISRPVERLTDAARRLGGGDLGYRVPLPAAPREGAAPRRADELTELTMAFNDMAARVEGLVRSQRTLLANVSHELRSPLARVRVALALLPPDDETARRVAAVERDLEELDRLIETVLASARLEATGLPARPGPLEARALLGEVAARAGDDPRLAGAAVRVAGGPEVPLVGDAGLLRLALSNLVENAAKYGDPPITLDAGVEGGAVWLAVTDEGPGVPAAERERVLEPFYRLDAARTPAAAGEGPRGVGHGLTLARQVAEAHGGRLAIGPATVAGGVERGCRVALLLPAGGG